MIIVLILIALAVLSGVSWMKMKEIWSSDGWIASGILTPIALLLLTLVLIFNHGTANSTVAQYNMIKETIEVARQDDVSDIERATLTQKIMKVNQEIASHKYWNGTVFHLMVPDKLAELEPLK